MTLSLEKKHELLFFVLEDGDFSALIRSLCEKLRVEQATPVSNISALLEH